MLRRVLMCLALVSLTGCSSPWFKDVMSGPEHERVEFDPDEQIRLGYLGRYMAATNARRQLEARVHQTRYVRQWDATDNATMTSMMTDIAVGNLGSSLGQNLGTAVFVPDLFSGDGSWDATSQVFLPREYAGHTLETASQAQTAARNMIRARLESVAGLLNSQLECVHGCGEANVIYRIRLNPETLDPHFIYRPWEIIVLSELGEFLAVEAQDPVSALVGFDVAWKSQPGNYASVRLFSEGRYDEQGELELERNDEGFVYPRVQQSLLKTQLGLAIFQHLSADNHLLLGFQGTHPGTLFFEGQVYGFYGNASPKFIDRQVYLKPLTQQKYSLNIQPAQ